MSEQAAFRYLVGVFETVVIIGKIHSRNLARAEELMQRREGPGGEELDSFSSGTEAEILATYPGLVTAEDLREADQAYARNPLSQVQYDRRDFEG